MCARYEQEDSSKKVSYMLPFHLSCSGMTECGIGIETKEGGPTWPVVRIKAKTANLKAEIRPLKSRRSTNAANGRKLQHAQQIISHPRATSTADQADEPYHCSLPSFLKNTAALGGAAFLLKDEPGQPQKNSFCKTLPMNMQKNTAITVLIRTYRRSAYQNAQLM